MVSTVNPFDVASPDQAYGTLDRIDPTTMQVIPGTKVDLVSGAGIARSFVDGEVIWFPTTFGTESGAGLLFAFDAISGQVLQTYDLSEGKGYGSNSVVMAFGSMWTASGNANEVRRFQIPALLEADAIDTRMSRG